MTGASKPARAAVRTARPSGLLSTSAQSRPASTGRRARAWASPTSFNGGSLRPVWRPDMLHAVSPCRTVHRSGPAGVAIDRPRRGQSDSGHRFDGSWRDQSPSQDDPAGVGRFVDRGRPTMSLWAGDDGGAPYVGMED